MKVSRRGFFKLVGTTGAALVFTTYFDGVRRVFAQIPGGTLDPLSQSPNIRPPCSSHPSCPRQV